MFLDRLSSTLDLTLGTAKASIEATGIKRISLRARPWGFTAEIHFTIFCTSSPDEDTLFAKFIKPDLIVASLSLKRTFDEVGETTKALVFKGVVLGRSVQEQTVEEIAGAPVMQRHYVITFADRAQALWPQHHPTLLLVDSTYKALIDANLPEGLTLEHGWSASSTQRPIVSVGLGAEANEAHFYDFVFWLLDREGCGLFYDPASDKYKIADAKPSGGTAKSFELDEVEAFEVRFPPVRREKVVVLNSFTDASERKKEGTNAQAVDGVRADTLMRSPVASDLDNRSTLEAARARQHVPGVWLSLTQFPAAPPAPSDPVSFSDDFSSNLFVHGKSFRVVALDLDASEASDEGGGEADGNRYEMRYDLELEQTSDPVFASPPFVAPRWPFLVEGKVVSEIGATDEETYQIYTDSKTSLDMYRVAIPLFENKQVIVSFEPMMLSGHFYFPAYKGERVLIALDLDRAQFAGYLDWRPGARLPLDSQGNHLLLGKKAASETSIRHVYEDAKPVLSILRTSDKDQQLLRIFEGTIFIEVKENSLARGARGRGVVGRESVGRASAPPGPPKALGLWPAAGARGSEGRASKGRGGAARLAPPGPPLAAAALRLAGGVHGPRVHFASAVSVCRARTACRCDDDVRSLRAIVRPSPRRTRLGRRSC